MSKIKVWTRQNEKILDVLNNTGVYYCKEEYIDYKMENFSEYYKKLYNWYTKEAEKIVPKPCPSIKYPIWVSIDEAIQLQPVAGTVILELLIPKERLVITDMEKWGYVVNFFYLPKDIEDYKAHQYELKRYNISNPAELIMGDLGNFHPILKNKVKKSWKRLFDDYSLSGVRQGTLWEIHENDIIKISRGTSDE